MKLTIRIFNMGNGDSARFIQDESVDPHAHQAYKQVNADLEKVLRFEHKQSEGVLAFGEFFDTYISELGEVFLYHDADPGDLTFNASNEVTFKDVISKLIALPNYEMQASK
jgi:hypothetical protein